MVVARVGEDAVVNVPSGPAVVPIAFEATRRKW
jgi:hypothetical protein